MKRLKSLYPGSKKAAPTMEGLRQRALDSSGIEVGSTMNLSTPIVSAQDGPRLMGVSNFGGKKAAPFRKGGKRRAKVLAAKAALKKGKKGADLSNVDLSTLTAAARKALPASAFVFPSKRAYPIHDKAHARNALARSAGKPEHPVVVAAVRKRYPDLDHDGD